jgi:hypothetical protein
LKPSFWRKESQQVWWHEAATYSQIRNTSIWGFIGGMITQKWVESHTPVTSIPSKDTITAPEQPHRF